MPRTEPNSERRLRWIARIALAWMLVIGFRLVDLQIRRHDEIKKQAEKQQERPVISRGVRGTITDENGQALAISVPTDTVYVSPKRIESVSKLDTAATLLATGLHMKEAEVRNLILSGDRGRVRIARKVPRKDAAKVCGLSGFPGYDYIWCEEEEVREHPAGNLAAHVLGPVGSAHEGLMGIERSLQRDLKGRQGKSRVVTDSSRRAYQEQVEKPAEVGAHIRLTINADIQFAAEQALAKAIKKTGAPRGAVVVMDPKTGAVLAMASWPTFDVNNPPLKDDDKALENLVVKHAFEPGSVFKIFTMAAAFETTTLKPETTIDCGNGSLTVGKAKFRDVHGGGVRSIESIFANSLNTGTIHVGTRVGFDHLRRYVKEFGFGAKTGIEIAEVHGGIVSGAKPGTREITRVSQSIGYAIDVTPMQIARATSAIANGGMLVTPYLVSSRRYDDGREVKHEPEPGRRVIRPETAITMRRMMEAVVLRGTGRNTARLEGYTAGGKTGTSRYHDPQLKRYVQGKFNASFAGMAPLNDPRIVVVVNLFGTHGENVGFGGATAGPVFKEVSHAALRILGIHPDPKLMKEAPPQQAGDDVVEEIASNGVERIGGTRGPAGEPKEFSFASVPFPPAPPNQTGQSRRVFSPTGSGRR